MTTNEPSVLMSKPYFTAHIETANCSYSVLINGVGIHRGNRAVTVDIPINHWLRSGENEIRLLLFASKEKKVIAPNAVCSVSLQVRGDEEPSSATRVVSRLEYSGQNALVGAGTKTSTAAGKYDSRRGFIADQAGDVEVGKVMDEPLPNPKDMGTFLIQKIVMPLPFPEWAFFTSDLLPEVSKLSDAEYDDYVKSLLVHYKRIEQAIRRNDVDEILPLFEERNREMDAAMYFPPGTYQERMEEALKNAASDPDLELVSISELNVQPFSYSNKRLVELVLADEGPAIGFDIRGGGSESFPITFRRQNGQWIITR